MTVNERKKQGGSIPNGVQNTCSQLLGVTSGCGGRRCYLLLLDALQYFGHLNACFKSIVRKHGIDIGVQLLLLLTLHSKKALQKAPYLSFSFRFFANLNFCVLLSEFEHGVALLLTCA